MAVRDGVVLIVTREFDPHTDRVVEWLTGRGERVFRFHPADFPISDVLSFQYAGGTLHGLLRTQHRTLDLSDVKSAWHRRPDPFRFAPRLPENEVGVAKSETQGAVSGLYSLLDCLWVNSPAADTAAGVKLRQLREATRVGFRTPRSLVSTDPREVLDFYEACNGKMIYKTLGKPLTIFEISRMMVFTSLVDATSENLEAVSLAPCLFQEYVPKEYELRITVVGRQVLACEIQSQLSQNAETHVDWRHYSFDDTPHTAVELPPKIRQACLDLVRNLGLCFGAIDMIRRPDGEYVFLEINPSGQYGWLEHLTGLPITAAVGELLAAGESLADRFGQRTPPLSAAVVGYSGDGTAVIYTFNSSVGFRVSAGSHRGFVALGTMALAHYFLRRLYCPNLATIRAAELAMYCLQETSFQSPHVGGQMRVANVRWQQPVQFLTAPELAELVKQAESWVQVTKDAVRAGDPASCVGPCTMYPSSLLGCERGQ